MQLMMSVDGISHPAKKRIFDNVYKSLNISYEEGLSFLNYSKSSQINMDEHYSIISKMDLEKKKDLISILTVLSTIGKDFNNEKSELLTGHRAFCDLTYKEYSMLQALLDAKKYIV